MCVQVLRIKIADFDVSMSDVEEVLNDSLIVLVNACVTTRSKNQQGKNLPVESKGVNSIKSLMLSERMANLDKIYIRR